MDLAVRNAFLLLRLASAKSYLISMEFSSKDLNC